MGLNKRHLDWPWPAMSTAGRDPETAEVLARCELIEDVGEATTVYDRLWTEIKAQ